MTVDRDATDGDGTDRDATDRDATDRDASRARDLDCGHAPAVAYEVGFAIAEDLDGHDGIDSACAMRATVHEVSLGSADADGVGCAVADCEHHHEHVAESLRVSAARHSGNVTRDDSCR